MCGIVGLYLKDPALRPDLGAHLARMLTSLGDRGPDSAGIAVYGDGTPGRVKLTLQSPDPDRDFAGLDPATRRDTHAVLTLDAADVAATRAALAPGVRVMSLGERIEIFKETGRPADVAARFDLAHMGGTHGIGHTRMATESAVTTLGAHPFSTGPDQCLVHNGSLSNHNTLRRDLVRAGMSFETQNDSEVAAAWLSHALARGLSLRDALTQALAALDGFYTFVVGTRTGFAVLRDPVACKPAVLAETDAYVAFGSEYRALADLPGIEHARVWEPEPARVYAWEQ